MKFPLPAGVPRYTLESFFGEHHSQPNKSMGIHPQELLRKADIIIGEDVMSENQFLMHGRDLVERFQKTGARTSVGILVVTLDQDTDDLEKFAALIEITFGKCDYQAG